MLKLVVALAEFLVELGRLLSRILGKLSAGHTFSPDVLDSYTLSLRFISLLLGLGEILGEGFGSRFQLPPYVLASDTLCRRRRHANIRFSSSH